MTDLPAHIVAVAIRALPLDRREWAMAMTAELAQLRSPSVRWKFALGCARAALMAPRHPTAGEPSLVATVTFLSGSAGKVKAPAIISTLHVLPFMIMELVNRRNLPEGFPIPLFVFMWLLGLTFVALATPIVRTVATGTKAMANPVSVLPKVVFLILIAWVWVTLVVDQLPCFLGVPNCD